MAAGDKKYGRNSKDAERYQREGRLEKNKRLTALRHAKRMAKKAAHRSRWEAKQRQGVTFSEPRRATAAA